MDQEHIQKPTQTSVDLTFKPVEAAPTSCTTGSRPNVQDVVSDIAKALEQKQKRKYYAWCVRCGQFGHDAEHIYLPDDDPRVKAYTDRGMEPPMDERGMENTHQPKVKEE